ncbi:MAG: Acryloyl-CoA reductase electron transfer subunit gamma [Candidatus Heimdallarchaeota archaeon LC_2]|nr:MAG: Acryloyl-CoA reductase electron transfer subunit gamma [Candidatus Heimdallarchaeota archaeon LC_2]
MTKTVSEVINLHNQSKTDLNIYVMIKQVPIPKAMKTTAEGLMDRSGKSQMNPHCTNALEEALSLKDKVGGTITMVSMGPPNAQQSLNEAIRKGADRAYLLSDRKLAGSDTWATAEALAKLINHIEEKIDNGRKLDIIFAGLQTIDGDTAHVGPQVAGRLGINQVTYVEDVIPLKGEYLEIRRIIEGGFQRLKVPYPMMLSITHTANVPRGPSLNSSMSALEKDIILFDIASIGLPDEHAGLPGSPTVVSRVKNVQVEHSETIYYNTGSMEERIEKLTSDLISNKEQILENG